MGRAQMLESMDGAIYSQDLLRAVAREVKTISNATLSPILHNKSSSRRCSDLTTQQWMLRY